MRYSIGLAMGLAAVFASAPAAAQSFGRSGDVSFAADRLMGLYILNADGEGGDTTSLAFGASPWFFAHPYTSARLGIDFFPIDHLSIGGSLAFFFIDTEARGDDDATGFLFAPRVGYAINIGDSFGFWPRGGFTFRNFDGNDEVALTLEGMFFATPGDHFGFLFGPALDAGLAGEGDEALAFSIVNAGVFGWF